MKYMFLPRETTFDIAQIVKACFCSGVTILRWKPGDPWSPPDGCQLDNASVYGSLRNGRPVAKMLGGRLVEPRANLLTQLPPAYVKRKIDLLPVVEARKISVRRFFKPAVDKSFPSTCYPSGNCLPPDLDPSLPTLVEEIVAWSAEYRTFVLHGRVVTASPYRGSRPLFSSTEALKDSIAFAQQVVSDEWYDLPSAFCLDVGLIPGAGWAVVEANPVSASCLYSCDPMIVLRVLDHAIMS